MKEWTSTQNRPQPQNSYQWSLREKWYQRAMYRLKLLFTILMLVLFAALICGGAFIIHFANERESRITSLEVKLNELIETNGSLSDVKESIDILDDQLSDLQSQILEKQSELDSINKSITDNQAKLNDMSYDVSIMEKYNYALYDTNGDRNDITIDLLKQVEDKCNGTNIDPNLVLGIVMVESEGHAGVTNSHSGAAGLGQFMPDTGEFIANNYLNLSYDHSVTPYDKETNINMMVEYLSYLYNKYNGDIISMIKEYSGGDLRYAYNYYAKVLKACNYNI